MATFFRGKRGGAISSAIALVIFLALFSIVGSVYLAVGTGNPVNKVTNSLLSNQTFKVDAGKYFVSKALETATGDEKKLLTQKGEAISQTVTSILGNPILKSEVNGIGDIAYHYYTDGNSQARTIDVKPLATLALLGLEAVDPQFSKLQKELNKIKPIDLKPQNNNGPSPSTIKSLLSLSAIALFVLSIVFTLLYLLFARSRSKGLKTLSYIYLGEGIFLFIVQLIAKSIVNSQAQKASESLAREAIPIAASSLLASFITLVLVELVFALGFFGASFLKRVDVNGQS
mgnify:CR=1 FL=1